MPYIRYCAAGFAIPYYVLRLLKKKYDWIIIHFAGYGEAEALAAIRLFAHRRQRYSIVFHFPREQVPHRYSEFEKYALARDANLLIGVSDYVAKGVRSQFDRPCVVVHNGVDENVFSVAQYSRNFARRELSVPLGARIIISLTALEERKGVQRVIRALPSLLNDFPELLYWVIGNGPYRSTLDELISDLGLHKHVRLFGSKDDVLPFLAAADIGCLLSHGEAFGIAVLEQMAMELPVLVSRRPPFDEFVRPRWGEMVDEADTEAVVSVLRGLLSAPERCKAMGRAARQEILRRYTWDKVAERYLSLFSSSSPQ